MWKINRMIIIPVQKGNNERKERGISGRRKYGETVLMRRCLWLRTGAIWILRNGMLSRLVSMEQRKLPLRYSRMCREFVRMRISNLPETGRDKRESCKSILWKEPIVFERYRKLSVFDFTRATSQTAYHGWKPEKYSFSIPRYLLMQTLAAPRSTPVSWSVESFSWQVARKRAESFCKISGSSWGR